MNKFITYALLSVIACVFAACNSKADEPNNVVPGDAVYDFVTLASTSGSGSTFTLRKDADSPLITYTTSTSLSGVKELKEGSRLIISYARINGDPYTSGGITLYGYRLLDNTQQDVMEGTSGEFDNWYSAPLQVITLTRTGNYLNVQAQAFVYKSELAKAFVLVADKATLGKEVPELHMIYTTKSNNDGENPLTVYGSFDISKLWSKESCKGLQIEYMSPQGLKHQRFMKATNENLQPNNPSEKI